jgi:TRAP-type C4-dicarboxylate transport system permease small subunit
MCFILSPPSRLILKGVSEKVANQPDTEVVNLPRSNGFSKFIAGLSKVVDPLCKVGGAIGGFALAYMMFLTIIDVLGRAIGSSDAIHKAMSFVGPVPGSLEMTELMLGVLISFGLGYTALKKGHIRVDLLLQYTSQKQNYWFDVITYLLSFVFYCGVTWQAWLNGFSLYGNHLSTANLHIPIYPFPFILVLGAAIVALVFLRDFLKAVEEVMR